MLNFSLSPLFNVGIIFIFIELLGLSEIHYGILMTIFSTAMLLSPLLLGKKAKSIPPGNLIVGVFILIGLLTLSMFYATSSTFIHRFNSNFVPLLTLSILVFAISMLTTIANITVGTLFDTLVPREYYARVSSVKTMGLLAAFPLGQILFGLAIDLVSISFTIASVGFIALLSTAYFRKSFIKQEVLSCNIPSIQSRVRL